MIRSQLGTPTSLTRQMNSGIKCRVTPNPPFKRSQIARLRRMAMEKVVRRQSQSVCRSMAQKFLVESDRFRKQAWFGKVRDLDIDLAQCSLCNLSNAVGSSAFTSVKKDVTEPSLPSHSR